MISLGFLICPYYTLRAHIWKFAGEWHKTARWDTHGSLAQAGSRPPGPQHLTNYRDVLCQKRHHPPARNHRRVQLLIDAFLMLKQTEFLRTDETRWETTDAPVMIRQGRGRQTSRPLPKHMPEYSQKTSAVDPKIYGALAGAEGLEPSARGFGVDVENAWADIQQPVFRVVEPFVFPKHTLQKFLMPY